MVTDERSAEFEMEYVDCKTRQRGEGTIFTKVPYYPLRDKVVVRNVYEETTIAIRDEASMRKAEPISTTVVAYGDEVHGIEIGDKVDIGFNASIKMIDFKENSRSVKKTIERVSNNRQIITADTKPLRIKMVEYYVVQFISINGVIV